MMPSMRGVTKRIQAIKFRPPEPDEIRRMSATKIITGRYVRRRRFPIDMGLMDSHLGVIEPVSLQTCAEKSTTAGPLRHIDLAMPVIHVGT